MITLLSAFYYKNKLPFDLYKEVLLNYRKILPQLNIQDIQDYAYRTFRIMRWLRLNER